MISVLWIFPAMLIGALIALFMVAAHETTEETEDPEDEEDDE